jgi:hypothetical protein
MREEETLTRICYRAVGMMSRTFSVIIETIKHRFLQRLIRPSAEEFGKDLSLRHRAPPAQPPSTLQHRHSMRRPPSSASGSVSNTQVIFGWKMFGQKPAGIWIEAGPNPYFAEIAQNCGPGYHWVGRHCNRNGAWFPGHCARN